MITPSFGLTATERVLPRLALDFTTASLDPRVTFTRTGNTATVTNSSGYVAPINADLPRFDYNPITLACNGLLIEESRTNSIVDSAFQTIAGGGVVGSWYENSLNMTATTNASVDPANTNAAALASITANTSSTAIFYQTGLTGTATYTFSVYVKPNSTDLNVSLILSGDIAATNFVRAAYTLSGNGTAGTAAVVGTATAPTATSISRAANGFYRITITAALTSATNILLGVYPGTRTAQTTASQTLMWGSQLELGAFATSVIPTTVSQVTRTADVATMTGTNFSDWFNPEQGAFVAQANSYTLSGKTVVSANDATNNNIISVTTDATTGVIRGAITTGGSGQTGGLGVSSIVANTTFKAAIAYKENSAATGGNGLSSATDTTVTLPTVNQLTIGTRSAAGTPINGWMQKLYYYPQRILNAELAAFTK